MYSKTISSLAILIGISGAFGSLSLSAQLVRFEIFGTVTSIDSGAEYFGPRVTVGSLFTETFIFRGNPPRSSDFGTAVYSYFPNNYSDLHLGSFPASIDTSAGVATWSRTPSPAATFISYGQTDTKYYNLYSTIGFSGHEILSNAFPSNFPNLIENGVLLPSFVKFQATYSPPGIQGTILGAATGTINRFVITGSPVPEPSSYGVTSILILALAWVHQRRKIRGYRSEGDLSERE